MNKRVIAVSGAQGTGKSVLAYDICSTLKKKGLNIVVLDELARECPFKINKDAGDDTQAWLICKQISRELELLQKYDYIISDRSVIDAHCFGTIISDTIGRDFISSHLYRYAIEHIKTYYKNIYVPDPVIFNYNFEDGVRDTDEKFRLSVHNTVIETLSKEGIDYLLLRQEGDAINHMLSNLN